MNMDEALNLIKEVCPTTYVFLLQITQKGDLKYFLNMLQSNNAGVDVFEVNSNFTTFKKVVYDKNTNSINRTNCD